MKRLVVFLLVATGLAFSQQHSRFDKASLTVDPQGRFGFFPVLAMPNVAVSYYVNCTSLPCSTPATTYISQTSSTTCPSNAQVTYSLGSGCKSTSDAEGNFGGWFDPGAYEYTITYNGTTYGPYFFGVDAAGQYCLSTGCVAPISDKGGEVYDVTAYGAKCDGVTDDYAAIQGVINLFSQQLPSPISGGAIYFPRVCAVSHMLSYYGAPGNSIRFEGPNGRTRGAASGAAIKWIGPAGGTVVGLIGANNFEFSGVDIDQNGLARIGVHVTATNTINTTLGTNVSPGVATVTPGAMTNITVGALINVGSGSNMEFVYVTAVTGTTFTATFEKSHLSTDPVGNSPGTSGFVFADMSILKVPGSTSTDCVSDALNCTAGIALGNVFTVSTLQVSEGEFRRVNFESSSPGNSTSALVMLTGGNVKNFGLSDINMFGFKRALDWSMASGTMNIKHAIFSTNTVSDVVMGSASLVMTGCEAEDTGASLLTGTTGANLGEVTISGCSWQSANPTSGFVINYQGTLTLLGNEFIGDQVNPIKIEIGSPIQGNDPGAFTSIGNSYYLASNWAPIYGEGGVNPVFPIYYHYQSLHAVSLNDIGGSAGALTKLNGYVGAYIYSSQQSLLVSSIGVMRCGDTDTCMAFRNHGDTGDVNGISKDASDIVHVGDSAGIAAKFPTSCTGLTTGDLYNNAGTPAFCP